MATACKVPAVPRCRCNVMGIAFAAAFGCWASVEPDMFEQKCL